jgi:2'-5' RNA ligase
MRLFVALDIDSAIRERLAQFRSEMKSIVPDARWVGAETFHVTLKFIGEQPESQLEAIKRSLATIRTDAVALAFRGIGFFPTAKAARVFWVGIEAGKQLASLAGQVDFALASLGIPKEDKPYAPHLTLARGRDARSPRGASGRPGITRGDRHNSLFAPIQDKFAREDSPEFGSMTASEFFLYESRLSPSGAHYTKLARFPLNLA